MGGVGTARGGGGAVNLRATLLATQLTGRVSARVSGWFAARLWFTPWPVEAGERAHAREAAWLAPTTPVTFTVPGGTVRGYSTGVGPRVLLVHGWGDRASRLGAFVAPLHAAGFAVVAVDLPAHGDSSGRRTSLPDGASALRAVADQLGGVDAIVAHSMGAATAMVAMAQGLDVRAAALLAPAVSLEGAFDTFTQIFALPPRAVVGLRNEIERRFGRDVWQVYAGTTLAPRFDVPALIVHDDDDPQVPVSDGVALAAVWPGAQLVRTKGLAHHRVIRDDAVIERVRGFLAATVGTATVGAAPAR